MLLMSILIGDWILMELADMSSVSMLERLILLYIICLEIHAPYTAVSQWISRIRRNSSLGTLLDLLV